MISKNTDLIMESKLTPELAELVGIMFGDGCLYLDKKRKYHTIVCFHKAEKQYMYYVKELFEKYFKKYKFYINEQINQYTLVNVSVFIGKELISFGLKSGNKVKNKITIPDWIFTEKEFMIRFLRGLFDTDGSIYRKYDDYAQIQFKQACEETVICLHHLVRLLGFNPTKIQKEPNKQYFAWKFYLSRQKEIDIFFEIINPMNKKNQVRYKKIRSD